MKSIVIDKTEELCLHNDINKFRIEKMNIE